MKISFVIPAYNAEKFIRKCVESITSQGVSEENYEVIVVNDGSKDQTESICKELAKEYRSFRFFSNENHGPGYTRNYGIRNAKGKYIWCIDADDYLSPHILESVLQELSSNDPMYLIGFQHIDETGNALRKLSFGSERMSPSEFLSKGYYVNYVWCRIIKRSLFEEHSLYFRVDLLGPEDYDLTFRLMKRVDCIKCIDLICYNYILNPASLMNSRSDAHMQKLAEATITVGKDLRQEWNDIQGKSKQEAFDGWLSNYLYGFLFSLYRFKYKPSYIKDVLKRLKNDENYPVKIYSTRGKHRIFTWFANRPLLFLTMVRLKRLKA
nr:glycosyltransferase family 2 protein [Allomuricauda sp.]